MNSPPSPPGGPDIAGLARAFAALGRAASAAEVEQIAVGAARSTIGATGGAIGVREEGGPGDALVIPLEADGAALGSLWLDFPPGRRLGDAERALASMLAQAAALALGRIQAREAARVATAEAHAIQHVAEATQERLQRAFSMARMYAWELDVSTMRVTFFGDTAEILGVPRDAEFDRAEQFEALVHPDDAAAFRAAPPAAIGRGQRYFAHYRIIRPRDGAIVNIESCGEGQVDESGKLLAARGVVMDITARVRAESQRAEAELSSHLKDEFLARVSHELRTPLAATRMWIHVLRAGGPEHQKAALEAIDRSAQAQSRLIEDLLDLARGVKGKLRITEELVELRAPIEEALAALRPEAEAKSILLLTALSGTAGFVRGDPGRLRQVVTNLVDNAIKFTPLGGRVEVLLRVQGDSVVLTVADNGVGIDAGALEDVFLPFHQRAASGDPAQGGLGLGLAITRQLVELHHGTIRAESRGEGKGTVFTVVLPRVARASTLPPPPQPARRASRTSVLAGVRVLLVEDHPATREGIAAVLTSFGAAVTATDHAAAAFAEAQRSAPEIIVSDLGLPGEDGCQLLARLRALGGPYATIPAVALTAHARTEDAARVLAAGFQVHLAKPAESHELVNTLARLLGRPATATPRVRRSSS